MSCIPVALFSQMLSGPTSAAVLWSSASLHSAVLHSAVLMITIWAATPAFGYEPPPGSLPPFQCDPADPNMLLIGRNLTSFDNQTLSASCNHITQLLLERNPITGIPPGAFKTLSNLERLSLEHNELSQLAPEQFQGLGKLQGLWLAGNPITAIQDTFGELPSLVQLDLTCSRLVSISIGAFQGLSSLKKLVLTTAQLNNLQRGVFEGLGSLLYLYLDHTGLTEVTPQMFDGLTSLNTLYLSNSQLQAIAVRAFAGLPNLQYLLIQGTNLKKCSSTAFEGLNKLEQLHLGYNSLFSLPDGVFDALGALVVLQLNHNKLGDAVLSSRLLAPLQHLQALILDHNDISFIPSGAPFNSSLRELSLEYNRVSVVETGAFGLLSPTTQLKMLGNPSVCNLTVRSQLNCACGTDRFSNHQPQQLLTGGSTGACLCPAGQKFLDSFGCFQCEKGSYSSRAGAPNCTVCGGSVDNTTSSIGSTQQSDCHLSRAAVQTVLVDQQLEAEHQKEQVERSYLLGISISGALVIGGLALGVIALNKLRQRALIAEFELEKSLRSTVHQQGLEIAFLRDWR